MNVLARIRRTPGAAEAAGRVLAQRAATPADVVQETHPAEAGTIASFGQTIVVSGVGLTRDRRSILDGIDLVLTERRIAILGANGSGKTSLLKSMIGLVAPTAGSISVGGADPVREADTVRGRTGFLFQNPDNQIVHPIVREDLAFGLAGRKHEVAAMIEAALARLGIAGLVDRRIHELSGGERQLVALASVLVRDPLTILFDEPTSQLDLRNRNRLVRILAGLPQQAVVVTHDLEFVTDFDRVLVMEGGRIVCDAAPSEAIAFYRGLSA